MLRVLKERVHEDRFKKEDLVAFINHDDFGIAKEIPLKLIQQNSDKNYDPHELVMVSATSTGDLDLVKRCVSKGFPESVAVETAVALRYMHILKWLVENNIIDSGRIFGCAFRFDYIDVLWWAIDNIPKTSDTNTQVIIIAIIKKNTDLLEYCRKKGYRWNYSIWSFAISQEDLEMFKWALDTNQCKPRGSSLVQDAIHKDDPEIVELLLGHGFKNVSDISTEAVRMGSLNVLKWAREAGYLFNRTTWMLAIRKGRSYITDYLIEIKCPGSNV